MTILCVTPHRCYCLLGPYCCHLLDRLEKWACREANATPATAALSALCTLLKVAVLQA